MTDKRRYSKSKQAVGAFHLKAYPLILPFGWNELVWSGFGEVCPDSLCGFGIKLFLTSVTPVISWTFSVSSEDTHRQATGNLLGLAIEKIKKWY